MAKKTKKPEAPTPDNLLEDTPTVTIAGEVYEVQKLGFKHVFRVGRIIGNGLHVLGDDRYTDAQVAQVLVASMAQNEEPVLTLIADLLGVSRKELDDAERFPMHAIVDVVEAIARSQDLHAFLAKVKTLGEKLPEMWTASREPSAS